jgi:hypothetical protein
MTASPRREVDANLLHGAAPGSAQARAGAQDAGRQDLGDLVQALGRGDEVVVEGVGYNPVRFARWWTAPNTRDLGVLVSACSRNALIAVGMGQVVNGRGGAVIESERKVCRSNHTEILRFQSSTESAIASGRLPWPKRR